MFLRAKPLNSKRSSHADRIAVVSYSLGGGGAERVVIDLCRYLRDNGREVMLLTLCGEDPDAYAVPKGVRRERMEVRRVAGSPLQTVWYFLSRMRAMRRKLRGFEPDVVVSFIDMVNVWTLICLLGTGIPVILSERVHPAYNPIPRIWQVARSLIYPFAAAVTVQTKDGAEWFRRWTRIKRPVVISNAARDPHDLAVQANEVAATSSQSLILAIGRLTEQKGFDLLLEAYYRSGLAQIGWHLAILGEGPERYALKQQAIKLGVADLVSLPGFVDVGQWLCRCDIFVLSSRFEGFPNALMEAMQMQRACISFDCPSGPGDLIENGRNGLLVPPQDVTALSEALQRLAADTVLRLRLGAEASKIGEQFSPVLVYGKWLRLIDAVSARRPALLRYFGPRPIGE